MSETETEVIEEKPTVGDDLREALAAAEESEEVVEDTPEEKPEETEIPEKEAAPEEGVAEATGVIAPEHWPTEEREAFGTLPEEAKTFALTQGERLEALHQKRQEELASQREVLTRLAPIDQELAPYREQLRLEGVDERNVVKQLMAIRTSLATAPKETIQWLAQQTGVDLGSVNDETFADPTEQRLNAVEQQVANVNQQTQQAISQTQVDAATRQAQTMIDTFSTVKNDDGNLKYPHFEAVQGAMTELATADRAAGKTIELEDVYQRAVWLHPDTREKLLTARDSNNEADVIAKEKKNQRQRTSRARRADTTIRSTAEAPSVPEKSLRQELSDAWKEATN